MTAAFREKGILFCVLISVLSATVFPVLHAARSAAHGVAGYEEETGVWEEADYPEDGGAALVKTRQNEGTICSVLGYDLDGAGLHCGGLDQDIFRFTGTQGERISLRLEADPPDPGIGKRAMLILTNRSLDLHLFRRLNTGLPHGIAVRLPVSGEYCVVVAESPPTPGDRMCVGERYRGSYCITLKASPQTSDTFREAASVEPRSAERMSGPI